MFKIIESVGVIAVAIFMLLVGLFLKSIGLVGMWINSLRYKFKKK